MKITGVAGFLMSYPMPEEITLPFWGGVRTIVKRDAMLIKVSTDTSLVGYGPGPAFAAAAEDIRTIIEPFLVGKDPRKWRSFSFSGSPEVVKTYHAVEIALLDLLGKFEGCSIADLMGGKVRSSIKVYGSAGMYMPPEQYAEEATSIQARGFQAYKMRPGLGPDEDLRAVELMRSATGPAMGLMIDAHTWWRMGDKSYTPETVTSLAKAMSEFNPYWLEEPFQPDNHEAYRALKARGFVRVATGEHEQSLNGFADLAARDAAHFLQMDVCCQGGFEMGLKVFDLAASHAMKFAFHSWGTMLEVLAAAQLGVCRDESVVEWLEYPCYSAPGRPGMYSFPLADEILAEPLQLEKGYLMLPDGPGLGIAVCEDVIQRYPFVPGPWSLFRQDSPKATIAVTGDHSVTWVEDAK